MEIKQFKVGDIVKVIRPTSISPTKRKKSKTAQTQHRR